MATSPFTRTGIPGVRVQSWFPSRWSADKKMAEQQKRGSPLDSNGQIAKKQLREQQAVVPCCVVKQEQEEPEEGELMSPVRVSRAGAVAAAAAAEAMEEDEPQIKLRFGISLFHCRACLRPLRPPTFKCEVGHVVCGACRVSHAQACDGAGALAASPDVDLYVRGAKLPCPNRELGCDASSAYYQAGDHERACQWAPCRCPGPGCGVSDSPARLVAHVSAAHGWPVTDVGYARAHRIVLPRPPRVPHVLAAKEDGRVFLVSASSLGAGAVAASLVCVRANGGAAAGAPQFRCTLWVEDPRGGGNVSRVTFAVASSDLSGGGVTAAEQGMFLAVPRDLLRDAPGETTELMVRIDKAAPAAPPARCSTIL